MPSLRQTLSWLLRGMPLSETQKAACFAVPATPSELLVRPVVHIKRISGALSRRSHVSTQSAEYYLRPEHKDHQVAIVIRLFMTGRRVTSLTAMLHLREMANLSVRADNVIREAEQAFRRAGIPMQSEWVKLDSKKRIKARWLDMEALRTFNVMRGA